MVLGNEKVVAAIGVSEEDVAHLRLLMRKAAKTLTHTWRWGSESSADLFVIDPQDFAGQMARARAQATGMRVAVVCDAGVDSEGDLALHRPFKELNVVDVLNAATQAVTAAASVIPARQNFYYSEEPESSAPTPWPATAAREDAALGLDEMIRGNPLLDPFANLQAPRLDASVSVDATPGSTLRSEVRSQRELDPRASEPRVAAPDTQPPPRRHVAEDRSAHRLRSYLSGDLLGGPVQIAWPDAGVLVLDPKNQVFHSDAGLQALEPYCCESPRRNEWRALTTAEMTVLRATQPAQPYAKLIWLDVLLRSGGKLAAHLDPGGTYRLMSWLEIRRDYPRYARIAAAMMQPMRLHEIATASASEMSDVFDVVNAFDAIGLLEWSKRAPRHVTPVSDGVLSGIMQKLRKPFSKD